MAKPKAPPFGNKTKFENSKFDKEPKGMKEGSPAEEALDRRQAAAAGMPYRKGGKVRRK